MIEPRLQQEIWQADNTAALGGFVTISPQAWRAISWAAQQWFAQQAGVGSSRGDYRVDLGGTSLLLTERSDGSIELRPENGS